MRKRIIAGWTIVVPALAGHPVSPEQERQDLAKSAAQGATGGKAVWVARVPLNGCCLGYQVRIHMPGRAKGWLCDVDLDVTPPRVRDQREIPNPEP